MNPKIKMFFGFLFIALAVILTYKNFTKHMSASENESTAPIPKSSGFSSTSSGAAMKNPHASSLTEDEPNTPSKFAELPCDERNALINKIQSQGLDEVFQQFLDAERIEKDEIKQSTISTILGDMFRRRINTPEFDAKIIAFIRDKKNTLTERCYMLESYSKSMTSSSFEILLWAIFDQPDDDLKVIALDAISYLDRKSYLDFLLPKLKPHWLKSDDPEFLNSAALAMARQGKTEGIQLLFASASAEDGRDDLRRQAALEALPEVLSDDSVPYQGGLLMNEKPGSKLHVLAANTLSEIGSLEASRAFMKWAQTADDSGLEEVTEWCNRLRSDEQILAAKELFESGVVFRSEKNKETLRAGIEAFLANYAK